MREDTAPPIPTSASTSGQRPQRGRARAPSRSHVEEDEDFLPAAPAKRSTSSSVSRQFLQGKKRQRRNNEEKQRRLKELEASEAAEKRMRLEAEKETAIKDDKIRQLEQKLATAEKKVDNCLEFLKPTYSLMSSSGKSDFKKALHMAKHEFPEGTNLLIRNKLGINLSNPLQPLNKTESKLRTAIKDFVFENSSEVPDKDKVGMRYCHQFKFILYHHYISNAPKDLHCSLKTFYRLWPRNVRRPTLKDYGR